MTNAVHTNVYFSFSFSFSRKSLVSQLCL